METTDAKDTKEGLIESLRSRFGKHSAGEILRHLPLIAEIIIEVGGFVVPGAAKGALRLMRNFAKPAPNEGRQEIQESANDNVIASIVVTQEQLTERCTMLEEEHANMKSELARSKLELTTLRSGLQTAQAAVESLEKRNVYLVWGLLIVGLLALSELALRLIR